jgi:hypothetical protein
MSLNRSSWDESRELPKCRVYETRRQKMDNIQQLRCKAKLVYTWPYASVIHILSEALDWNINYSLLSKLDIYEQASRETTYNIGGILGMRQRICGGGDQQQTLSCWWHPSMWSSTVCHHSNALYLPIAVITPWHIQKGIHGEGMLDSIGLTGHTVLIYHSLEETL